MISSLVVFGKSNIFQVTSLPAEILGKICGFLKPEDMQMLENTLPQIRNQKLSTI